MALEWEDDAVVAHPDAFSDSASICTCGDIVPTSDMTYVKHVFNGVRALVPRCPACQDRSMCSSSLLGVHTEIYTPDSPGFRDDIVDYDPDPPKAGQFFRTLIRTKTIFPNEHQYGYCSACGQPMRWSPTDFRWVDWPEATRRRTP